MAKVDDDRAMTLVMNDIERVKTMFAAMSTAQKERSVDKDKVERLPTLASPFLRACLMPD